MLEIKILCKGLKFNCHFPRHGCDTAGYFNFLKLSGYFVLCDSVYVNFVARFCGGFVALSGQVRVLITWKKGEKVMTRL